VLRVCLCARGSVCLRRTLTFQLHYTHRETNPQRLAGQGPVRTIFTGWIEKLEEKEKPTATPVSCMM
jgi:hypothetical protein